LSIAGDHVPAIEGEFEEVAGKENAAPEQTAGTCVNVGVMFGFTVTVIAAVKVHKLAVAVKMYSIVLVLSIAGDHVPAIEGEFVEVAGKENAAPEHTAGTCINVGVMFGFTVIVKGIEIAHCPVAGTKV
jgi:hypothetical protein